MNVISKTMQSQSIITGRLSDGSDRQETVLPIYTVKVDDGTGLRLLAFEHDPTNEEINIKLTAKDYQDITDNEYLLQQQIDTLALEVLALKGV